MSSWSPRPIEGMAVMAIVLGYMSAAQWLIEVGLGCMLLALWGRVFL
jgi:hypothetical protein